MAADARLAIALLLMLGAAAGVLTAARIRVRRQVVVAAVRATGQLAVIGVLLGLVFRYPVGAAVVLAVMLATATRTAARRLRDLSGATRAVLAASLAGALCTLVFACWLALGATPRQAVRDIARTAAAEALLPAIDQTRTVGLVTLPGAFVGALFGGARRRGTRPGSSWSSWSGCSPQGGGARAVTLTWLLGAPNPLPLAPFKRHPHRPGRCGCPERCGRPGGGRSADRRRVGRRSPVPGTGGGAHAPEGAPAGPPHGDDG